MRLYHLPSQHRKRLRRNCLHPINIRNKGQQRRPSQYPTQPHSTSCSPAGYSSARLAYVRRLGATLSLTSSRTHSLRGALLSQTQTQTQILTFSPARNHIHTSDPRIAVPQLYPGEGTSTNKYHLQRVENASRKVKVSVTIIVNPFPTADHPHCPLMRKLSHFPNCCCRCNILSTHQPQKAAWPAVIG